MTHRLSDWPECWIEVICLRCQARKVMLPVRMLLERGDRSFASVVAGLRCKGCGGNPAPVYLVAGQQRTGFGPPPSWAVELVPAHPPPKGDRKAVDGPEPPAGAPGSGQRPSLSHPTAAPGLT
jgi:hypothetical protein